MRFNPSVSPSPSNLAVINRPTRPFLQPDFQPVESFQHSGKGMPLGKLSTFSGKTALHRAARENDAAEVERLVKQGEIDVNERDESDNNNTALHTNLSLRGGIPEMLFTMMKETIGDWFKNEDPDPKIAKALLVDGKADATIKNGHGRMPFHIYLLRHSKPNSEIVTLLLDHGTKLDVPDSRKHTVLYDFMMSHYEPDAETIRQCLQHGATLVGSDPESLSYLKTVIPEEEWKNYPQLQKKIETEEA
jgi:hypothetical protein